MTGWRIGYTAAPAEVIRAMTVLQGQTTTNPTSIAQAAAATALVGPQDSVAAMAHEFTERLQLMVEGLGTIPGVHLVPPQGAFYVFPDLSAFFGRRGPDGAVASATDLSMYLLRRHGPRVPRAGGPRARPPLRPAPAAGTGFKAAQARSHSVALFVTPRNMKRRKPIACLLSACRRQTCGTRAGPRIAQRGGGG